MGAIDQCYVFTRSQLAAHPELQTYDADQDGLGCDEFRKYFPDPNAFMGQYGRSYGPRVLLETLPPQYWPEESCDDEGITKADAEYYHQGREEFNRQLQKGAIIRFAIGAYVPVLAALSGYPRVGLLFVLAVFGIPVVGFFGDLYRLQTASPQESATAFYWQFPF